MCSDDKYRVLTLINMWSRSVIIKTPGADIRWQGNSLEWKQRFTGMELLLGGSQSFIHFSTLVVFYIWSLRVGEVSHEVELIHLENRWYVNSLKKKKIPLGDVATTPKVQFSNSFYEQKSRANPIELIWCQVYVNCCIDDKAILVRVMAWCRQAASHYVNQC